MTEPGRPIPAMIALIGAGVAGASVIGAGAVGPPYLEIEALSPWIVIFATALFAALFAFPFAAHRALVARRPGAAERWEAAMLWWGALATGCLALGIALIAGGGFSPGDTLADAVGLLLTIEAGLVVLTLGAWLLSS